MIQKTTVNSVKQSINTKADMFAYIDKIYERHLKIENENQTLLPEDNLKQRLYKEVEELFEKYPNSLNRPPLFGIFLGVKDIFKTDGFPTKAGSGLPAELFEGKEASSVTKLKEAGAIIYGKTTTTEFAYSDPSSTKNPHNLLHTPGGSSSGSAALVALGQVPVALGTQTIGSIIRPATYCGIVGYKPSFDRIDKDGVIPFASSVDHIGCFSQDIKGSELVASILCENWKPNNQSIDKIKIAIPVGNYMKNANSEVITKFNELINFLKKNNVEFEEANILPDFEKIKKQHWDICYAEPAEVHKNWYKEYKNLYRKHMHHLLETGQNISQKDLEEGKKGREVFRNEVQQIMDKNNFDLIIAPSSTDFAPKGLESTGNSIMNLPWTFAGMPAINIPFGKNENNLPFGFQIIGRFMQDEKLFNFAQKIFNIIN